MGKVSMLADGLDLKDAHPPFVHHVGKRDASRKGLSNVFHSAGRSSL